MRSDEGEEPIESLDVHRPAALAAFEEVAEAVKFGVSQRFGLGESFHGSDFNALRKLFAAIGYTLPDHTILGLEHSKVDVVGAAE